MDGGSRRVEVKEGRRLSAMEVKEGWGLHGDGGKRGMDVKGGWRLKSDRGYRGIDV